VFASDERERDVVAACEGAVHLLGRDLEDPEISCLLLDGDRLRNVAHRSRLRLISEIPREQGGIAWRTLERAEAQLVEDVRRDPDYLTSDPSISSEIAAPVLVEREAVAVLDLEFPGRVFGEADVALVRDAAARLGTELARYAS
jgi:GAF domain-containing protein